MLFYAWSLNYAVSMSLTSAFLICLLLAKRLNDWWLSGEAAIHIRHHHRVIQSLVCCSIRNNSSYPLLLHVVITHVLFPFKPNPCPGPDCCSNLNGLIQPSDQVVIWSDNATVLYSMFYTRCRLVRQKVRWKRDFFLFGNGLFWTFQGEKKKLRPFFFQLFFFFGRSPAIDEPSM